MVGFIRVRDDTGNMTEIGLHKIKGGDADALRRFIKDTVDGAGSDGVVVGISGGLDSAVVTKLCVDALGADRVTNIFMPTTVTSRDDYREAMDLSKLWGTRYKIVEIQPAVDAFTAALFSNKTAPLERGNITARCRMVVLFNYAKKTNGLVVGTSNRSELMMGYFTKFGDGAADLFPIADLYKTQVRELAKMIDVPAGIIDKVPTAGLWEGQTDEDEMGITYRDLDLVLDGIAKGKGDAAIAKTVGVTEGKVDEVRTRSASMEHKRLPPLKPRTDFN